ncbi:unnamed protein product [Ectocarpus fasciculatus]
MNVTENLLATILGWLFWNFGRVWNQTVLETPRIGGAFVDTAAVTAGDLKGSRNNPNPGASSNNPSSLSVTTRAASYWSFRVILLVAVAAIRPGLAEGTLLFDLPSDLKCAWYNLSHPAQYAALVMTVGCLYGVNRLFDKLDSAAYARLSSATGNWMRQRREALGV